MTEHEEETRPMERRLTDVDRRIIEAAQRAIDRERAKGNSPTPLPAAQKREVPLDPRVQKALDRAYQVMQGKNMAQADETSDRQAEDNPKSGKSVNEGTNLIEQTESEEPHDNWESSGMSESVRQEISADQAAAIDRLHTDDGMEEPETEDDDDQPEQKTEAGTQSSGDAVESVESSNENENQTQPRLIHRRTLRARVIPLSKYKTPEREEVPDTPQDRTAVYLDAFFAELQRCGVEDYVISPGSRSTGLAMKAFERFKNIYIDIDERGAAFFALGLAKVKRKPVGVICTSGTAVGNWMPAVLEAESSRVPLLFLSSDRPARLQHMGAPQTCDQLKLFGDHVKKFVNMPEPSRDERALDYARQTALECCIAAYGSVPGAASCDGGPVHVNFPFDEPLKPAKKSVRDAVSPLPPTVVPGQGLYDRDARGLFQMINGKRAIAICGEGSINTEEDAQVLLEFARKRSIPLLADPLSGLRSYESPWVIDNYDTVLGRNDITADVVIRFGRWPVSKRLFTAVDEQKPVQVAVDVRSPRDYSSSTDLFVHALPVVYAQAMLDVPVEGGADEHYAQEWMTLNDKAAERIGMVRRLPGADQCEGAYVDKMLELIPENSLLFSANSMSIRAVDTFYRKSGKKLRVLCNRGLNGIDGTLSSAIGAAQAYRQTTLLIGDLAFLHDCNALALQNEMHIRETRGEGRMPSIVVVVLNNNGGAIFDMLSQKSSEDYFGRLFLTPQNMEIKHLAQAFGVTYRRAETLDDFRRVYQGCLSVPGISIVDIPLPLAGVKNRYRTFW